METPNKIQLYQTLNRLTSNRCEFCQNDFDLWNNAAIEKLMTEGASERLLTALQALTEMKDDADLVRFVREHAKVESEINCSAYNYIYDKFYRTEGIGKCKHSAVMCRLREKNSPGCCDKFDCDAWRDGSAATNTTVSDNPTNWELELVANYAAYNGKKSYCWNPVLSHLSFIYNCYKQHHFLYKLPAIILKDLHDELGNVGRHTRITKQDCKFTLWDNEEEAFFFMLKILSSSSIYTKGQLDKEGQYNHDLRFEFTENRPASKDSKYRPVSNFYLEEEDDYGSSYGNLRSTGQKIMVSLNRPEAKDENFLERVREATSYEINPPKVEKANLKRKSAGSLLALAKRRVLTCSEDVDELMEELPMCVQHVVL